MYWVGRSTIPDRSLSLSKVLFIFTQANTTTDASSTETRWSKGTQHPLGTILCTFSCPLDKLAGYLRNLLGKMDPAKHRYPQLSNLSLRNVYRQLYVISFAFTISIIILDYLNTGYSCCIASSIFFIRRSSYR